MSLIRNKNDRGDLELPLIVSSDNQALTANHPPMFNTLSRLSEENESETSDSGDNYSTQQQISR